MRKIQYQKLETLNPDELMKLLNKQSIRKHLVNHRPFDLNTVASWVQDKHAMDCIEGCRVRGIVSDNIIAGWCGIQYQNDKYEIAIVLDKAFWGTGLKVFSDTLSWAKELGHDEIFIHLLDTRPEYRFLRKISKHVYETEMSGHTFTTYQITVCEAMSKPVSSDISS